MIRDVQISIQVWTETYQGGRQIQEQVEAAFANRTFDLAEGRVIDLLHDDSSALQEDDPTETAWQFIIILTAVVRKDRADTASSSSSSSGV